MWFEKQIGNHRRDIEALGAKLVLSFENDAN